MDDTTSSRVHDENINPFIREPDQSLRFRTGFNRTMPAGKREAARPIKGRDHINSTMEPVAQAEATHNDKIRTGDSAATTAAAAAAASAEEDIGSSTNTTTTTNTSSSATPSKNDTPETTSLAPSPSSSPSSLPTDLKSNPEFHALVDLLSDSTSQSKTKRERIRLATVAGAKRARKVHMENIVYMLHGLGILSIVTVAGVVVCWPRLLTGVFVVVALVMLVMLNGVRGWLMD